MHITSDRYLRDRRRHDLALRMIRHEARTCTIRACTGLTDDRIRRLYRTYADTVCDVPVRRRRGKSPRQIAFFLRNTSVQFESALLASTFSSFGLLKVTGNPAAESIALGALFCDAYETHRQLVRTANISFEHAWFLFQLLSRGHGVRIVHCRHCDSQYLRDRADVREGPCPVCRLQQTPRCRSRRAGERARPCSATPRVQRIS
jgi:hypothetical protein